MARKKINSSVECLDMYEDDDDGFIEGDVDLGKSIASFSFGNNMLLQNNVIPTAHQNFIEDKTPYLGYYAPKFQCSICWSGFIN